MTGFPITRRIRAICTDMVRRLPELQHIDMGQVTVSFTQARKRVLHGTYATLTPMRFERGERVGLRHGQWYAMQRLLDQQHREQLYILSVYLPRFMDTDFDDKLVTLLHEIWHISPDFDGDLRRFAGRCYAHSHSCEQYDRKMLNLMRGWLQERPPAELYEWLKLDFEQLRRAYGPIFGLKLKQPRLLPVSERTARELRKTG